MMIKFMTYSVMCNSFWIKRWFKKRTPSERGTVVHNFSGVWCAQPYEWTPHVIRGPVQATSLAVLNVDKIEVSSGMAASDADI